MYTKRIADNFVQKACLVFEVLMVMHTCTYILFSAVAYIKKTYEVFIAPCETEKHNIKISK
jgi:hypothetical protein